ncbi:MAG: bifunctional aspartate kinase/homoserine dehydrogenase I [Candidatus Levybacteria bacterium]|nr:bifunctional aspartate kinase/homoserine dehydrogenase I [Candidatus Levybacteria bacterium]MDZ4228421.1 bifunctional aspartate kinase/homoserine dehydrogenase I [Candidatus Levybacteria bacterium]
MKILKFGGSSVANAENIRKVIQIISESSKKVKDLIIVVSALGGVTDNLIKIASLASEKDSAYKKLLEDVVDQHNQAIKKLIKPKSQKSILAKIEKKHDELNESLQGIYLLGELSLRSLDKIMSFGEQLSAYIISEAIRDQKIECKFIDSRSLIKTDDNFGSANVSIQKTYELLSNHFQANPGLSIMGGFIASTDDGIVTTLGRGGSDYTASLVGAAVSAEAVEIWTDVDGVMTADPRKVEEAFPLLKISYEEAGELAHFGAKVIHPKTMKPARLKNIPIDIKNTFNPDVTGTRISNGKCKQDYLIKGISSLSGVVLFRIQSNNGKSIGEVATKIFDILSRFEIEILLITQASYEQSISLAVNKGQAKKAKNAIEKAFALELKAQQMFPVSIEENLSIVAIVGKQMKGIPGISGKLFSTLGNNKINVIAIAQGSSELNVSVVISSNDEKKALQVIHDAFFKPKNYNINLFLVGIGLIGSTLLKQINESNSPIRLCGLANSNRMFFDSKGISQKSWKQELTQGKSNEPKDFVARMLELNLPNSVFVDCTASEEVVAVYANILKAGVAIVTPNKKANSGAFKRYQKLRKLAQANKTPFLYETNVGAGLPIVHTIQGLISSGDKILKIEAVLSGTLSYIFNTFSSSNHLFSQIVRDAKVKGYTEPDPRDDLNGMDVARKILILARETGLTLELDQINVKPLLPKECFSVGSIDDFFAELKKQDDDFNKAKITALKSNKVLRYTATLSNGKAEIGLQEVGQNHPFYHLSGSDNIISITTKRYNDTPLVIKGPGAGAEVTAGGVLSNILSIFN